MASIALVLSVSEIVGLLSDGLTAIRFKVSTDGVFLSDFGIEEGSSVGIRFIKNNATGTLVVDSVDTDDKSFVANVSSSYAALLPLNITVPTGLSVEESDLLKSGVWVSISPNYYGIIGSIDSTNGIVSFKAYISDFSAEGGSVEIAQPLEMSASVSYTDRLSASEIADVQAVLATKCMYFNKYWGYVAFVPVRLSAGSTYYYVSDKLAWASAVDDGTSTHTQRFNQKNYFSEAIKESFGENMFENACFAIQRYQIPDGSY